MLPLLPALALSAAFAAPNPSADALFAKGRYAEALPLYERQAKAGGTERGRRALFRAVECEALLFRYVDAAVRAEAAPLPEDPLWRARLLLLRAETEREASAQYGWAAPQDEENGSQDPARRTRAQWRAKAAEAYAGFYPLRRRLANEPLPAETYFVDTSRSDLAETPTLWDFAAGRWMGFLLDDPGARDEQAPKPDAAALLAPDHAAPWSDTDSALAQAAALAAESARLDGRGRALARELWLLQRVDLIETHSGRLSVPKGFDLAQAVQALRLRWLESFTQPAARAQAGFDAAGAAEAVDDSAQAVELCRRVERDWPGTRAAPRCALLRARIERPTLGLEGKSVPPPGTGLLRVSARNLDAVSLRLYKTSPAELQRLSGDRSPNGWQALRGLEPATIEAVLKRAPVQAWTVPVKSTTPYAWTEAAADAPAPLTPGLYVAVASSDKAFAPGRSRLTGVIVSVTDLVLFQTAGPTGREADFVFDPHGPQSRTVPAFHYYAADARTGRPVQADLDVYVGQGGWGNGAARLARARAGDDGTAELPASFHLAWDEYSPGASADALGRRDGSLAFANGALWASHEIPAPIRVMVDLDRPLYRPGQRLRGKVTVLRRLPLGFSVYAGTARPVVTVRDAHRRVVSSSTLTLDDYGAAEFSAELPPGTLLGRWDASVELTEFSRQFSGSQGFQVEEYKRPEFEVTLSSAVGPWRYGRPAVVGGEARYYFGGAAPGAPVTWRVVRREWLPWWCWWWRPRGGDREVASGATKTGADGRFSFTFTPEPAPSADADAPRPASFAVTVDARDAGGRTIQAARTYQAGAQAYLFAVEPPAGFLKAGAAAGIPIKLMTLDERAVAGRGRFELRRITGAPEDAPAERGGWDGGFPGAPSVEELYRRAADGPVVASGALEFPDGAAAPARLPGLREGAYRLTVSAQDPWGGRSEQKIVLLSVSERPSAAALPLPAAALPEHASYAPGETARVLVGSAKLDGFWLEVWGGAALLERRRLSGGPQLVSLRVGDDHRGGFTLRWFGVKDGRARGGEVSADVPWSDKRLSVSLDAPAAALPGQKVSWTLGVKDSSGRPVDAQALVRVFDRSLEYYAKQDDSWFGSLYADAGRPGSALSSVFAPWAREIPPAVDPVEEMQRRFARRLEEPQPPRLRLNGARVSYGRRGGFGALAAPAGAGGAMIAEAAPAPGGERHAKARKAKGPAEEPGQPAVAARADFSETAYFEPRLPVQGGRGTLSFTLPERLTSWKVQAVALTQDARGGAVEAAVATRKDLMVRVEMPRFLREGDAAELRAVVDNQTDRPLSGTATLSVARDSAPAEALLGLSELRNEFTAPARGQAVLSWPARAPRGAGTFEVTAAVRSGALVDAERRELPLLPSRQRLVESVVAALDGPSRAALRLPSLASGQDATRRDESLTLELDPQLALTVLAGIPYLVHYPYECTEQVLDRYVPLSIVDAFFRKDPRLAQAAAKIPKRATLTRAWDRSDPRRLTELMETPWEEAARGREADAPVVDILDAALVERERADAQAKLLSYQNADGSYSWFPGGGGDPYMTLLVLAGWAQAQRYGVEIPLQAARQALGYVEREIPPHLRADPGELSLTLFAAYVLTSYPASLPEAKTGLALARTWAAFADAHKDALTPLGRAYLAHVYRALGDAAKSENYLDRALDGARRDPITGVYWAPEKLSWLWYHDTVETHAFLLKTLLELRPRDERVGGMVRWLLFNRVGNEWKSTRASAAAVYALLEVLRSRGALDSAETFDVKWGTATTRVALAPFDWLERKPRLERASGEIAPRDGTATIAKTGPGVAFASLTSVYTTDAPTRESGPGLTSLSRRYFKRVKDGSGWKLEPLASGAAVSVGDELEVHLTAAARAAFEYVQLRDPKLAGVEGEQLTSGWRWDLLPRYEEPRDSLTNFFMSRLPHGEYVLRYRVRPTTPGRYRAGAAVLQSMYAPEISAHSDDFELEVRP